MRGSVTVAAGRLNERGRENGMSAGNKRCDKICASIGYFSGAPISTDLYNRVYEAVDLLPDGAANRLVSAIERFLRSMPVERERADR